MEVVPNTYQEYLGFPRFETVEIINKKIKITKKLK